ncbi:MAG: hypothetical protein LBR23_10010 [Spirochaetaceae bacterium]|jgi:hypothetical protein|nr:hypothetical protein [Spirochaetaceae bacterium]
MNKKIGILVMCATAVFAACASNKTAPSNSDVPQTAAPFEPAKSVKPGDESGVRVEAAETILRDWQGRAARSPAIPQWIADIQLNRFANAARFLSEPEDAVTNSVYRGLTTQWTDLRGAQMRADAQFAREIAKELQTSINVYLAGSASSGVAGATKEAIREITQTKSEVELSGARLVQEFWQEADEKDPVSGSTTRYTILYRLYSFNREDWAQITAGYVQKVIDQLPRRLQPDDQAALEMTQAMYNDARHPIEMDKQQREQQLDAEQKMVDAQINLMPAEQRRAAQAELARIHADTATTLGQQRADASVRRTEAVAASSAEEAAYASGNPVLQSAASTTAADAPVIKAAKLAARLVL